MSFQYREILQKERWNKSAQDNGKYAQKMGIEQPPDVSIFHGALLASSKEKQGNNLRQQSNFPHPPRFNLKKSSINESQLAEDNGLFQNTGKRMHVNACDNLTFHFTFTFFTNMSGSKGPLD